MSNCKLLYNAERGADDFCFCKTKSKKKRIKVFHVIMPCTNWPALTSKSGTEGSWVVAAGGRVVREAGLGESTVAGESFENQSKVGHCQVPQRGQCKHIPAWVHHWGKVEPLQSIFEDERKFAPSSKAVSSRDLALKYMIGRETISFWTDINWLAAQAALKRFCFVEH